MAETSHSMARLPFYDRGRGGRDGEQAGTGIVFKQPTAVQGLGKLCSGLSQGCELIGGFPSACWERERC